MYNQFILIILLGAYLISILTGIMITNKTLLYLSQLILIPILTILVTTEINKLDKSKLEAEKKTREQIELLTKMHDYLIDNYKSTTNPRVKKISREIFQKKDNSIPMYYINLDKSIGRREFMEKQAKLYNLQMTRIEGVIGKELDMESGVIDLTHYKKIKYSNSYKGNTLGELGCLLSHIKSIYNSYINGDSIAMFLEDDASFILYPYWPVSFKDIINGAPENWKVINLFYYDKFYDDSPDDYVKMDINTPFYSCAAFIINRDGMRKILEDILKYDKIILDKDFPNNGDRMEADVLIYHRAGIDNTYVYKKYPTMLAYNNTDIMNSTIHENHTYIHVDKSLNTIRSYFIETGENIRLRKYLLSDEPIPNTRHKLEGELGKADMVWNTEMCYQLIKKEFNWFEEVYNKYSPLIKKEIIKFFIIFSHGGSFSPIEITVPKTKGNAIFAFADINLNNIDKNFMSAPPKHPFFEILIHSFDYNYRTGIPNNIGFYIMKYIKKYNNNDVILYDIPKLYKSN